MGASELRTERIVLRIGKADGETAEVPMRFNASHQRGYRCFIGDFADAPENIGEETPRSFEGRTLFEALAGYRKTIEPAGWRLLHAAARLDCWPEPYEFGPHVQRLRHGTEMTQPVDGLECAVFDEVGTLADQHSSFEQWMKSLAPVFEPRVPPKAGHSHDAAAVDFSGLARLAGKYLVDGDERPPRRPAQNRSVQNRREPTPKS
jgi:hypothetical protein